MAAPNYQDYLNQSSQEALNDPYYKTMEDNLKSQYARQLEDYGTNLKMEYGRRGLLDSSYYTNDLAKGTAQLGESHNTGIQGLGKQRTDQYNTLAGTRYNSAMDQWRWEEEQRRKEVLAEKDRQATLQAAQYKSYSGGGGGGGTSKAAAQPQYDANQIKLAAQASMMQDMKNYAASMVHKMRLGDTESNFIPQMKAKYGKWFNEDFIKAWTYHFRKPYEG